MEQKDHDLLIRLDTKVTTLCTKLDKFIDAQDSTCKEQNDKIDTIHAEYKKTLTWKQFGVMLTVFLVIISGIIGFNYNIDIAQWKYMGETKDSITKTLDKHVSDLHKGQVIPHLKSGNGGS